MLKPKTRTQGVIGIYTDDLEIAQTLCREHKLTQPQLVHGLLENYVIEEEPEPIEEPELSVIQPEILQPIVTSVKTPEPERVVIHKSQTKSAQTSGGLLDRFLHPQQVKPVIVEETLYEEPEEPVVEDNKRKVFYIDGEGKTQMRYVTISASVRSDK